MDYSQYKNLIEANRQADPESFNEIKERAIVDMIRNGNSELGIPQRTENEELALLRKAVKYLYDIVKTLHKDEVFNAEFETYYADVEISKSQAKNQFDLF
jgi:hypothetical protein